MSTAQESVTKTYTRDDIMKMSVVDVAKLLTDAGPNAVFHGTAVVRKANGEIRYDEDAVPGDFGESADEMAAINNRAEDA